MIVEDGWQWLDVATEPVADIALPETDLIVPWAYWSEYRDRFIGWGCQLGVCINSDVDIHEIAEDIVALDLIALHFPVFADGRPYSNARLLRERYDFKGELRATGDILRDQLFFMHRCGFNAFQLREGKDLEDALQAFSELSVKYQTAADGVEPAYRYR